LVRRVKRRERIRRGKKLEEARTEQEIPKEITMEERNSEKKTRRREN
jgi:hypothetical protein